MKILFITHADFEWPGYFEIWAKNFGHTTRELRPYAGAELPHASAFDFLVVMGGPQSPLAIEEAPYLHDEIKLIQQTIKLNKPILGICLGAQLIGEALGAKTQRSPHREVGVYPIQLLDTAKHDPLLRNFPNEFDVMHWHSDMPGLSDEAVLLASSEGCPRQIIRYKKNVYGFQCHLELTKELVKGMIENCPDDLKSGRYIHTVDQLMAVDYSGMNAKLHAILKFMTNLRAKHTTFST